MYFSPALLKALPQVVGIFYTLLVGHVTTKIVVSRINSIEPSKIKVDYLVKWVGHVERCLYLVSLIFGKPEFIGVWLALKIVGKWQIPSTEEQGKGDCKLDPRRSFQRFLIGNGLSILISVIGYSIFTWGFHWQNLCVAFIITIIVFIFPKPHSNMSS